MTRTKKPTVSTQFNDNWLLDRRFFSDADIWRRELSAVFQRSWLLVAHESEVQQPGDYVTRNMASDEVVVSRAEDGEIYVLLNACTHRGTLLCKADKGNTRHFRCGYHGWTYSNDGSLRGVPGGRQLYGPRFDKEAWGLRRARVGNYRGLVFATFDPDTVELEDYLGDLRFYLDCFLNVLPGGTEAVGGSTAVIRQGNWKTGADNIAGDGYHLRHAHRSAFEMGIMGGQAGSVDGVCVQFENGHSLRAQHLVSDRPPGQSFPGYPEDLWPKIISHLFAEQANFLSDLTVTHGIVFPSFGFLHVPRAGGLEPGDFEAAALHIRLLNPLSPSMTEERMWTIVPFDYEDEWKHQALKSMQRQHGPNSFFESDDNENFRRIMQAGSGVATSSAVPSRYDLALNESPFHPWFSGPGHVVGSDLSEVNQRSFYTRYLDLMEE